MNQDQLESRLRALAPSIIDMIVDRERMGFARKATENALVMAVLYRPLEREEKPHD